MYEKVHELVWIKLNESKCNVKQWKISCLLKRIFVVDYFTCNRSVLRGNVFWSLIYKRGKHNSMRHHYNNIKLREMTVLCKQTWLASLPFARVSVSWTQQLIKRDLYSACWCRKWQSYSLGNQERTKCVFHFHPYVLVPSIVTLWYLFLSLKKKMSEKKFLSCVLCV